MTQHTDDFWLKRNWPIDPPGFVFLARAIHAIGQNVYGTTWKSTDPIPADNMLPDTVGGGHSDAKPWVLRRLNDALAKKRPASGRIPSVLLMGKTPTFTHEEWREAIEAARQEDVPLIARVTRMRTVVSLLQASLLSGEMQSFLRPVPGGSMFGPLKASAWNTESLRPRLTLCQLNPTEPFGPAIAGEGFQYIFVDAAGLEKALAPKVFPSILAAPAKGEPRSDEVRDMSTSATKEDITVVATLGESSPAFPTRKRVSDTALLDWFKRTYLPSQVRQPPQTAITKAAKIHFAGKVTRKMIRDMLANELLAEIGWTSEPGRRGSAV